ncbi:uncharacterized protein G2W53_011952 [Senna tora]|uniref:Uncharacterized protein n=1 Tax=Senna tora TaxID=362788 RepID=A0A834U3H2_9FABA|nr:uncharacterized protein G2W53_011952 [Senna tora]
MQQKVGEAEARSMSRPTLGLTNPDCVNRWNTSLTKPVVVLIAFPSLFGSHKYIPDSYS